MFSACQLPDLLSKQPTARAKITGSVYYPNISGWAIFYQVRGGVLLVVEVNGLPTGGKLCPSSVFGFHIHEGSQCTGTAADPFANTGSHYNPNHCPHPEHAGDLPPLFGNQGYAYMALFTSRFSVEEIIGRTIIIHDSPDDFKTQPSGNAGEKIACGQILRTC